MKLRTTLICACAALLAACASKHPAPVEERGPAGAAVPAATAATPAAKPAAPLGPEFYTVKRGDTLYGIALDHGQDYKEIAAWNNLTNPNVIQAGQVLRVVPPGAAAPAVSPDSGAVTVRPIQPPGGEAPVAAAPAAAVAAAKATEPNGAKRPYSDEALAQAQREASKGPQVAAAPAVPAAVPAPAAGTPAAPIKPAGAAPAAAAAAEGADAVAWAWPSAGKVMAPFAENGANKGLDLSAKVGDPVLAAGPGRVVYAGQGLRGYGRLIIIKHNATYLSAYAHNSNLLVSEGQSVNKGQKIAEAGNTDSDVPKLHFEIRRQGKPVDPAKYLPDR